MAALGFSMAVGSLLNGVGESCMTCTDYLLQLQKVPPDLPGLHAVNKHIIFQLCWKIPFLHGRSISDIFMRLSYGPSPYAMRYSF
jgi:hypothetical protein